MDGWINPRNSAATNTPTPPTIVTARPPPRSRKPRPQKPEPAVGPIVRQVRGKRVELPPEPPRDYAAGDAADRLFERVAKPGRN